MTNNLMLIILDGWGNTANKNSSAIYKAKTPFFDYLLKKYPSCSLESSGIAVGLPKDVMGNSEVGHINIGAGRVIWQSLIKINKSIEFVLHKFKSNKLTDIMVNEGKKEDYSSNLYQNPHLLNALDYAKNNNKNVHIMGLVSDGGIHSHINHLKALTIIAKLKNIKNVNIHAILDGRDTDPKSGINFLDDLRNHLNLTVGKICSIMGRYYAMDRDNRFDRTFKAYAALMFNCGIKTADWKDTLNKFYGNNITDEFINPMIVCDNNEKPLSSFNEGDVLINFNFRTDRVRQISRFITKQLLDSEIKYINDYLNKSNNKGFQDNIESEISNNKDLIQKQINISDIVQKAPNLKYLTFTNYDSKLKNVEVLYNTNHVKHTLGEILSKEGIIQYRIAETEKYPHVTYFFSGGREKPFNKEKRILCPSPRVSTYDKMPEMSAYDITKQTLKVIDSIKLGDNKNFICLNFANADMVGHTGVFDATIKACEVIDTCLKDIVSQALEKKMTVFITADHGNAEKMVNEDGSPFTSHTLH